MGGERRSADRSVSDGFLRVAICRLWGWGDGSPENGLERAKMLSRKNRGGGRGRGTKAARRVGLDRYNSCSFFDGGICCRASVGGVMASHVHNRGKNASDLSTAVASRPMGWPGCGGRAGVGTETVDELVRSYSTEGIKSQHLPPFCFKAVQIFP
jgi:hypothetical protein